MVTIDMAIVKKIVLFAISITFSFWGAYKWTPDLDDVEHRFWYRWAWASMWARGMIFTFQAFGWL